MRPLLTILGTTLLLSGIYAYTEFARHVKSSVSIVELKPASGEFSAEITCTFDCAAAPSFDLPAVEVRLADHVVLSQVDPLPRWSKLVVGQLPNVVIGRNEVIVQVHAAETESAGDTSLASESGCLRVQIFHDGAPLAEQSFWSEPGQPLLTGALMFLADIEPAAETR